MRDLVLSWKLALGTVVLDLSSVSEVVTIAAGLVTIGYTVHCWRKSVQRRNRENP